jgi:hypothetical protein
VGGGGDAVVEIRAFSFLARVGVAMGGFEIGEF